MKILTILGENKYRFFHSKIPGDPKLIIHSAVLVVSIFFCNILAMVSIVSSIFIVINYFRLFMWWTPPPRPMLRSVLYGMTKTPWWYVTLTSKLIIKKLLFVRQTLCLGSSFLCTSSCGLLLQKISSYSCLRWKPSLIC